MDVLNYKCPNCAAPLRFDSEAQKLICDSCSGEFDVELLKQYDDAMKTMEEGDKTEWNTYSGENWDSENMNLNICPSCGAEIVTDDTTAALKCPYCDNVTVLSGRLSGSLRPNFIIPFKISPDEAKSRIEALCKRKPLLPKNFISELHLDEAKGLYVPFWLFDCESDGSANFNMTRTRHWSDRDYNYTETSHYRAYREGGLAFERIPVDGSAKADDKFMESIEPFDYNEMIEFNSAYLSGFLADKYDADADASKPRANNRVKVSTEAALASTVVGYESVQLVNSTVRIQNGVVKYALLPVWMLHYKYKDKVYPYAINGQTGKIVGKLPISSSRSWAWFGGLFGACSVLMYLLMLLMR